MKLSFLYIPPVVKVQGLFQYTIYDLFTKFTFLFTIEITPSENMKLDLQHQFKTNLMKKTIYFLILPLIVVSGLVFANQEIKNETKPSPKPLSITQRKANLDARKKWEASPDGIKYKEWEVSPEGKKVHASYDKISKSLKSFTKMEAIVTSLTFERANGKPSGSKRLIVKINGDEYMMQFIAKEFQQLNSLKVNDKIIVRSRSAGYSPNHPYLILSSDYIERNGKILFKRDFSKNNRC